GALGAPSQAEAEADGRGRREHQGQRRPGVLVEEPDQGPGGDGGLDVLTGSGARLLSRQLLPDVVQEPPRGRVVGAKQERLPKAGDRAAVSAGAAPRRSAARRGGK